MYSIKPYKCEKCNRKYQRYYYYTRHTMTCSLDISDNIKSIKESTLTIDTLNTPSQIMQTITHLLAESNELKQELNELKRMQYKERQKIKIIDWLNRLYKPTINYKAIQKSIDINENTLEAIFTTNLLNVIIEILLKNIHKGEDKEYCFKAFDQKPNKIYVFTEEESWKLLTETEFGLILSMISKKILDEFAKWQDKYSSDLYIDSFSDIYLVNIKKINSINLHLPKTQLLVYKQLYNKLKQKLELIEYEIS